MRIRMRRDEKVLSFNVSRWMTRGEGGDWTAGSQDWRSLAGGMNGEAMEQRQEWDLVE